MFGASLLVSGVLLEAGARVYRYGPAALLPWIMESIRPICNSGLVHASPFIDIRYELLPNLDTYSKKVRFRTNSQGLRDQEYDLSKPANTYRVTVIGDSVTVPEGVEIEDAFHSLLEERLPRHVPGVRFEFINFAVAGYQLPEYVAMIRHRALAWQPDLILVGFCINDFFWDEAYAATHFNRPYEDQPTVHPFFQLHLLPWIDEALTNWRLPPRRGPQQEWILPEENRVWMMEKFKEFGAISAEARVPILFAFLHHQSRGYTSLSNAVRDGAAANGMYFVDLSTAFPPEGDPARYFIYRADGHPNAAAHRLFADTLHDFLIGGGVPGFPGSR
ncbi:MAG TPA: SGNH/GDSL hydrolase family protein [Candidatus Nitrosopolaris sp.]|nr:SGNH/GDSL hydrolase family protein [Candidatus Nitrosopolaris sp.]